LGLPQLEKWPLRVPIKSNWVWAHFGDIKKGVKAGGLLTELGDQKNKELPRKKGDSH